MHNLLILFAIFLTSCAAETQGNKIADTHPGQSDTRSEGSKDLTEERKDLTADREVFHYDPCGPGPTMLENGSFIQYGCSFLNHAWKIKHNGQKIDGNFQVCGAKQHCIKWLEYECGRFLLCNDGARDIIIAKQTGYVNTHSRSHQQGETLPEELALPLTIKPTQDAAPWNGG